MHHKSFSIRSISAVILVLFITGGSSRGAQAKDYFVDPESGNDSQTGSQAEPWRTLWAVGKKDILKAKDIVYLRNGHYGYLTIHNRRNVATITIAALAGHTPQFRTIKISGSSFWHLRGLTVIPVQGPLKPKDAIVAINRNSDNIVIEGFDIQSHPDISNWQANDWIDKARSGITATGKRITLKNNRLKNVRHGIAMHAYHSLVVGNIIENFSGDGIRALSNHTTFRHNTIKNCYNVDGNHDDGIQSYARGPDGKVGTGEIVGVVISGNRIINYEDPDQPFRCTLQGIGLFDGTFVDWQIENNVIITDHWHGITVMGARNVRVVNNTVMDPNQLRPGPPWITITRHKDGTPPQSSVIANNIAASFNPDGNKHFPANSLTGVAMINNLTVTDPDQIFRDWRKMDLSPGPKSAALDQGSANFAPLVDIRGSQRPIGSGVDIGAFESK